MSKEKETIAKLKYEIKTLKMRINRLTQTKEQIIERIEKKIGKEIPRLQRLNYEDLNILEEYIYR